MKKILQACLFMLAIFMPINAIAGEYALPKGFNLVLPVDGKVSAEWVANPLIDKRVKNAGFTDMDFRLGPDGVFWMAHRQKFLTDLESGKSILFPVKVVDFIFLHDKALFIMTDKQLGVLGKVSEYKYFLDAVPYVPFQPLCDLPLRDCRMEADPRGTLLIYGYDAWTNTYAVYGLSDDFLEWKRLFQAKTAVTAMCAAEDAVYVACGRMVYKVPRSGGEGKIIFAHPMESVRSLAAAGNNVFYATSSGAGLVREEGALEFMKAENTQLLVKDADLYAVFPDTMGILRLNNAKEFMDH